MSTIAVGERVTFLRATGWQWMLVEAVTGTVTELHRDAAIPFAHVALDDGRVVVVSLAALTRINTTPADDVEVQP
jgi:hypothetical protein